MSAKKKCCCTTTVGPCACNPGAPWVAGRSEFVKMRATFAGVTPTSPGLPWATAIINWWSVNSILPPAPWCGTPGYFPTPADICAHQTTIYNEGNTWRTGGSVPVSESDSFFRSSAGCGTNWATNFSGGPYAIPDIGTDVELVYTSRTSVTANYDSSRNKTYILIQGITNFTRARVSYSEHQRDPTADICSTAEIAPVTITRNLFESATFLVFGWFFHESEIDGKLCGASSHTFSNTLPLHTPNYTTSCGLAYQGRIAVCQTGTCTLTLIDA